MQPSDGLVRVALLVGVVLLIVIAGMNLLEPRRQRAELNDRLAQLLTAINTKPATPAAAPKTGPDPDKVYTVKTDGAPALGPKGAPITIAEFSDFQCPFCSKVGPTLKQVEETYKGQVQIVWKNLPLTTIHNKAMGAALASEAAHKQGKFWEFHDKVFANQSKLELDNLKQYAKEIGLNPAQFENDLADPATKKRVDE